MKTNKPLHAIQNGGVRLHQPSPPTISKPEPETTSSHKPYPTAAAS